MHYYKWHPADYALRTAHLSDRADCCYRRLIDLYYTNDGDLPASVEKIARLVRMPVPITKSILEEFFEVVDGRWTHRDADAQIATYQAKSRSASNSAGKRWADKRGASTDTESDASAMRTHCDGNANQEPITNNQEPITKNEETTCAPFTGSGGDRGSTCQLSSAGAQVGSFTEFWNLYPKKIGKAAAEREWGELNLSADEQRQIGACIARNRDSYQWQEEEGRFVPHPDKWLRDRRWEDESP